MENPLESAVQTLNDVTGSPKIAARKALVEIMFDSNI
jgi:hypothetical protein